MYVYVCMYHTVGQVHISEVRINPSFYVYMHTHSINIYIYICMYV